MVFSYIFPGKSCPVFIQVQTLLTVCHDQCLRRTDSGPALVLSQEEGAVFVDHLKYMASVGYGYAHSEIVSMASEFAVSLQKDDIDHPFSL